jgi:phage FluMu protein Com
VQEIRCGDGDCTRLVAKLEGGALLVRCPRCGVWRSIPIAALVQGMAVELAACTQNPNGAQPTKVFL